LSGTSTEGKRRCFSDLAGPARAHALHPGQPTSGRGKREISTITHDGIKRSIYVIGTFRKDQQIVVFLMRRVLMWPMHARELKIPISHASFNGGVCGGSKRDLGTQDIREKSAQKEKGRKKATPLDSKRGVNWFNARERGEDQWNIYYLSPGGRKGPVGLESLFKGKEVRTLTSRIRVQGILRGRESI